MRLTITIDCDNDAFVNYPTYQIGRILRKYANYIEENPRDTNKKLMDVNGNTVGRAVLAD